MTYTKSPSKLVNIKYFFSLCFSTKKYSVAMAMQDFFSSIKEKIIHFLKYNFESGLVLTFFNDNKNNIAFKNIVFVFKPNILNRMKKIISIILLSILFYSTNAQVRTAKVSFKKLIHDFGTIKEANGKIHHKFEFTNTGQVPLIITNVDASCGCTTPNWTKTPVLPGKSGFVDAEFDPANYQNFDKSITVHSNGEPSSIVLRIKGEVIPKEKSMTDIFAFNIGEINVKGKNIAFSTVKTTKSVSFEFYNNTDKNINLEFLNLPSYIKIDKNSKNVKSKQVASFQFTASSAEGIKGFKKNLIDLKINGKNYPKALKIIASFK